MKLIVEGRVATSGKVALDSGMFNACVIIDGHVAGQAQVSTDGEYELELETETMPETVELKILPSSVKPEEAGKMALGRRINSSRFIAREGKPGEFVLSDKFFLPVDYLEFIKRRARKYHVHGAVYLEYPTYFSTLPGCRIDFFEVDSRGDYPEESPVIHPDIFSLIRRQDFLGSAYTRADGSYDFYFKFGALLSKPGLHPIDELEFSPHLPIGPKKPSLFLDYKPDIRARFYLFINGAWTRIYDAPMTDFDWNIEPDFHRDYRIPADDAIGAVDPGTKPATGFRFKTIGLIPIDNTRIVDGYAHSQTGDPLSGITHEPFCGTLRIYGLFAAAPAVTTYTVELLKTDATGTAITGETWKNLGEPLTNLRWNDGPKRWDPITLGPTVDRYVNIDIEDPMQWLEPSLKAVWNSANCVNGYYKLRITGYDASNTAVVTTEMPMIRIDNDLPQAGLDVTSPAATVCGDLTIGADRTITFRVTAYDSDGQLHSYYMYGTRGRYAESAGATVYHGRLVANDNWDGVINNPEPFAVAVRSTSTIMCATMAYSFHLCVQGAGTNGYANCLESKRVWRETNLVVTE
jgi:hypothetical protein